MQDRPAAGRTLRHRRRIVCEGYEREDGLFEIEAQLLDARDYAMQTLSGRQLGPGDPLHEMGLRITVDLELTILDAQALTRHGPTDECPAIAPAYGQLKGLRIGPGFNAAVRRLFRGRLGCTHLTDLLGPLATTAFQTVWRLQRGAEATGGPPPLLDSCHAFRSDGEAVRRHWPLHYTGG